MTARLAHAQQFNPELCAFFDVVRERWFPNNVASQRLRDMQVRMVAFASAQDALKQLKAALASVKRVKPAAKRRPAAKKKRVRQ